MYCIVIQLKTCVTIWLIGLHKFEFDRQMTYEITLMIQSYENLEVQRSLLYFLYQSMQFPLNKSSNITNAIHICILFGFKMNEQLM